MELLRYAQILWRRKWVIVFTALVTLAVIVGGSSKLPLTYTASVRLRIPTFTSGSEEFVEHDILYADRLTKTYAELVTSRPVMTELAARLDIDDVEDRIKVTVEVISNTELMQINVEAGDPDLTMDAANTLAALVMLQIQALATDGTLDLSAAPDTVDSAIISIVEPAGYPDAPSSLSKKLLYAVGAVVGIAGGVGLAFFFEALDSKLYTAQDIAQISTLPMLGTVPIASRRQRARFLVETFDLSEAFRRLRTQLFAAAPDPPPKTLLVISAEPEAGKSTIVANLALSIAQTGQSVIVVDADLRRPALHRIFGLPNTIGLSHLLQEAATLDAAVQDSAYDKVKVLVGGPQPPNPAELLESAQMRVLLDQMAQQFDVVLIDAPAFLAVADASAIAPAVDEVLLVVRCAQAREDNLKTVLQQLDSINAVPGGVIVNHSKRDLSQRYQRYYRSRQPRFTRGALRARLHRCALYALYLAKSALLPAPRDLTRALWAFVVFAALSIPLGLALKFLALGARDVPTLGSLLRQFARTYLLALLVELFFRGVVQSLLERGLARRYLALAITALIFGVAHFVRLQNPAYSYVLMASGAGFACGWVWLRTGKITASALTYTLVSLMWGVLRA